MVWKKACLASFSCKPKQSPGSPKLHTNMSAFWKAPSEGTKGKPDNKKSAITGKQQWQVDVKCSLFRLLVSAVLLAVLPPRLICYWNTFIRADASFLCKVFFRFCLVGLGGGRLFLGFCCGFFWEGFSLILVFKVWLRLKVSLLNRSDSNTSRLFHVLFSYLWNHLPKSFQKLSLLSKHSMSNQ